MCQSRVPREQRQRELCEDVSFVSTPGWWGCIFQGFLGEGASTSEKRGKARSWEPGFPLVVT